MYDFIYTTPTKVYFGTNSEDKLARALTEQGCKCVLIHYGGKSAESSGLLDRVKQAVKSVGASIVTLGGVKPNPRLSLIEKGIELCVQNGVDLILAVGGGSVIDSSKAIALGVANGGNVWDFYERKRVPEKTLPVGTVLTISAAGSEMSNSSVITNDYTWTKRGLNSDLTRLRFAVMNPGLTATVPAYHTACGCADILMHTLERYLTGAPTMSITDGIAEALMKTVIAASDAVMKNPDDLDARANLMWASSLSHNGLTGCGGDGGDWCTHQLGHELSALFDVAHGASLTSVWGTWARYVYKDSILRFYNLAVQVMGIRPCGTKEEVALEGIAALEKWFKGLGLPTSIKELGVEVTEEKLNLMAEKCAFANGGKKGSCRALYREDMLEIYTRSARGE